MATMTTRRSLDAVERLTDADGKVEFKSVRAAVEEELEGFADEEDYLHMFSFVIDLGGRGGGFVRGLGNVRVPRLEHGLNLHTRQKTK